MEFGELIKRRRKELKLTQEELGERIGIQKSGVAKYENGRILNPKRSMIQKFATALEIDPLSLMGWDDDDDEDPEEFLRTHVRREEDQELIEDLTYMFNQFSELPEVKLMRMQIQTLYQLYVGVNEEK